MIRINREAFIRALVIAVGVILVLHLALQLGRSISFIDKLPWSLLDFNQERSVPTWLSAMVLFLCGAALLVIGRLKRLPDAAGRAYARHWSVLGVIFIYLSLDEIAEIHERLSEPFRNLFNLSGALHWAWVLPYAVFVLVVALAYLRFLWDLPPWARRGFILAGFLYVGGALGVELIGSYVFSTAPEGSFSYVLTTTVEELGELSGSILFLSVLLKYLTTLTPELRLELSSGES